jgi:thioredoxin reductase (NADPH)
MYDCIIIGAGPAGLLAAVYLARFRRSILIIDSDASRAAQIPSSHNYPGAAEGLSGKAILGQLRHQVEKYK